MAAKSNLDPHPATVEIIGLFRERGDSQYGGEAISQLEHALQTAALAEQEGATAPLIAAALLHDVGHLLHALPENAPDAGIDDVHETLAGEWLVKKFGPAVAAPAAMHVAAKRYLCAVDPAYFGQLSEPSVQSLKLQGGPMTPQEIGRFESRPYFEDAVRLRRWDDSAKVVGLATPNLEHFAKYIDQALTSGPDEGS